MLSIEDLTSAFNIFMLGEAWLPYQAFSKPIAGAHVAQFRPDLAEEPEVFLASKVIVMGWQSATSVMQAIHRKMLMSLPPQGVGLPAQSEMRRDKRSPGWHKKDNHYSIVSIYLDGFTEIELTHWNRMAQGDFNHPCKKRTNTGTYPHKTRRQ